METKRLIAFLVAVVCLSFVWQILFPVQPPKKLPKKSPKVVAKTSTGSKTSKTNGSAGTSTAKAKQQAPSSQPSSQPAKPKVALQKVKTITKQVTTKLYQAKLSNQGGTFVQMKLLSFYEGKKKNKVKLDLLRGPRKLRPPFVERFHDGNLAEHDSVPFLKVASKGKNKIVFTGQIPSKQGGHLLVEKTVTWNPKSYDFQVALKLTNKTKHSLTSKTSFFLRDQEDPKSITQGGFMQQAKNFDVLCRKDSEARPERVMFPEINKKKSVTANIRYIGLDRRYFLVALVPKWSDKDSSQGCYFSKTSKGEVTLSVQNHGKQLASGSSVTMSYYAFAGPKYYAKLKAVGGGGKLDSAIDFGFFAALSRPLLAFMQILYNGMNKIGIGNWGLAIILLTLLVKLLVFPFTHKSMKSMARMQSLKPEMDKLKEKYGDDKESMQRETMALYAKYGINPLGGCLPMLIQMPIWIGLYQMLFYAVELYQKTFIPGWIDDLSVKDPYYILPLLMGVSMFLQQKMTPQQATIDETQAKIMSYAMPIVFTVLMFFLPSSLTLYIFVNTIIGVLHHVYLHKNPPPISEDKSKKKSGFMAKMQQALEEAEKAKKARGK